MLFSIKGLLCSHLPHYHQILCMWWCWPKHAKTVHSHCSWKPYTTHIHTQTWRMITWNNTVLLDRMRHSGRLNQVVRERQMEYFTFQNQANYISALLWILCQGNKYYVKEVIISMIQQFDSLWTVIAHSILGGTTLRYWALRYSSLLPQSKDK